MLAGEPAMIKRAWRSGTRRACVDVRDSERGMIKRPDSRGVMLREHARLSDPCMTLPLDAPDFGSGRSPNTSSRAQG